MFKSPKILLKISVLEKVESMIMKEVWNIGVQRKTKVKKKMPVLDILYTEISQRFGAYRKILSLFGFLLNFADKTVEEIKNSFRILGNSFLWTPRLS